MGVIWGERVPPGSSARKSSHRSPFKNVKNVKNVKNALRALLGRVHARAIHLSDRPGDITGAPRN